MDADNRTLSRREYKPGKLPDSLTPAGDTAYILTETYKHDRSGAEIITWELYDQRDETLAAFYLREDGICVKRQTTLEWNR